MEHVLVVRYSVHPTSLDMDLNEEGSGICERALLGKPIGGSETYASDWVYEDTSR